jgi:hypothetical protein
MADDEIGHPESQPLTNLFVYLAKWCIHPTVAARAEATIFNEVLTLDSFEQVVSEILWNQGLWVWTSFKVKLTEQDKKDIGNKYSSIREIDVVAYEAPKNVVHAVECKSFFDSRGLDTRWLGINSPPRRPEILKLFTDDKLRKVIFRRLRQQLVEEKRCRPNPKIRLALACGHTTIGSRDALRKHFKAKGWDLYDEDWLREEMEKVIQGGYENRVSAVVAKLLSTKSMNDMGLRDQIAGEGANERSAGG